MPLHLSLDEFEPLANVLQQRNRELREEIVRTDNRDYKRALQERLRTLSELENKVLRWEFELDVGELDCLADLVQHAERELLEEIARTDRREFRIMLQERVGAIARVRERIAEACAMV